MSPTLNASTMLKHFECGNAVEMRNGIMFDFYPGLPHIHLLNNLIIMILIKMTELLMVCGDYFAWSFIDQALHCQVVYVLYVTL